MKNKLKKKIKIVFFISLIMTTIMLFFLIKLTKVITTFFANYAIAEANNIILSAINQGVTNETLEYVKTEQLFTIVKDRNDNIITIDYNSYSINSFLNHVSNNIDENLQKLENNILFEMPFGLITNNILFNNLGPKIPVGINMVGYVNTNVNTRVKEYGINNALIEMFICVEANLEIVLPITNVKTTVINEVPIAYKIIQGKIPEYYTNGVGKSSSIYSIPLS